MRKATEDALARTAAERHLAEELVNCGAVKDDSTEAGVASAREVLSAMAPAIEFERGTSVDPDRRKVPMRRVVITGAWGVDPDRLRAQQQED